MHLRSEEVTIAEVLKEHGYAVFKQAGRTFRQRHFADNKERAEVLANLDGVMPGNFGRPAAAVDVATHCRNGCNCAQVFEHLRPADITGVEFR